MKNNFFSVQLNFKQNLYSTYDVKVFLAGINILGRRDWTMKKVREMPLKVKRRRSAIPQAYELESLKFSNSFLI